MQLLSSSPQATKLNFKKILKSKLTGGLIHKLWFLWVKENQEWKFSSNRIFSNKLTVKQTMKLNQRPVNLKSTALDL